MVQLGDVLPPLQDRQELPVGDVRAPRELLRWKGIEATLKITGSSNSKVIVIGAGRDGLPLLLGGQ